jgi:hypothetical protein
MCASGASDLPDGQRQANTTRNREGTLFRKSKYEILCDISGHVIEHGEVSLYGVRRVSPAARRYVGTAFLGSQPVPHGVSRQPRAPTDLLIDSPSR